MSKDYVKMTSLSNPNPKSDQGGIIHHVAVFSTHFLDTLWQNRMAAAFTVVPG
jgi:hypothetical protein